MIIINFLTNGINKFDNSFGIVITRSSFTSNHNNSWWEFIFTLMLWGFKDWKVTITDIKDVHELTFIFMNTFNLNIIQRVKRNIKPSPLFYPVTKFNLISTLYLNKSILETFVRCIWDQTFQIIKTCNPLVNSSKSFTEKIGKIWVATMNPTARSYTVSLVLNFSGVELIEFTKNSFFQQIWMESGNTVDGVWANNR